MAGNGNPYEAMAKFKKMAGEAMPDSSWGPWLLRKVLGNGEEKKPRFEDRKDYGTTALVRKNEKIMELENALEEEKKRIAKKELDKAKLKEDKEKHRIADQRIKQIQLELENAKNKNKAQSSNNKYKHFNQPAVWMGMKDSSRS